MGGHGAPETGDRQTPRGSPAENSLGRGMEPGADDFAEFARLYDPRLYDRNDVQQLTALLEAIYKNIYKVRNDPEMLVYYAHFACEVAVFARKNTQVDICTLTFPIEDSPLAPSTL